jgi:hypothetical protein
MRESIEKKQQQVGLDTHLPPLNILFQQVPPAPGGPSLPYWPPCGPNPFTLRAENMASWYRDSMYLLLQTGIFLFCFFRFLFFFFFKNFVLPFVAGP